MNVVQHLDILRLVPFRRCRETMGIRAIIQPSWCFSYRGRKSFPISIFFRFFHEVGEWFNEGVSTTHPAKVSSLGISFSVSHRGHWCRQLEVRLKAVCESSEPAPTAAEMRAAALRPWQSGLFSQSPTLSKNTCVSSSRPNRQPLTVFFLMDVCMWWTEEIWVYVMDRGDMSVCDGQRRYRGGLCNCVISQPQTIRTVLNT